MSPQLDGEDFATLGGGITIMVAQFVCNSGIKRSSQSIDPHYLENRVVLSTLAPASFVQVAPGAGVPLFAWLEVGGYAKS